MCATARRLAFFLAHMFDHDNGFTRVRCFAGQDGSYLAEFLIEKGYTVSGSNTKSSHVVDERTILKKQQQK